MQLNCEQQSMTGTGASLSEMAAFIRGGRDESRKEREEGHARLEKQAVETEKQRQQLLAAVQTEKLRLEMPALQSRSVGQPPRIQATDGALQVGGCHHRHLQRGGQRRRPAREACCAWEYMYSGVDNEHNPLAFH